MVKQAQARCFLMSDWGDRGVCLDISLLLLPSRRVPCSAQRPSWV